MWHIAATPSETPRLVRYHLWQLMTGGGARKRLSVVLRVDIFLDHRTIHRSQLDLKPLERASRERPTHIADLQIWPWV